MRIPRNVVAFVGIGAAAALAVAAPGCASESSEDTCAAGATRTCACSGGETGTQRCGSEGTWSACTCDGTGGSGAEGGSGAGGSGQGGSGGGQGGAEPHFCQSLGDGSYCDGGELVACLSGTESTRTECPYGCDGSLAAGSQACWQGDPDFCVGKADGLWCEGDTLVDCESDAVHWRILCPSGCTTMPSGTPDECAVDPFCTVVPAEAEPGAPTSACAYMDWNLSADGFYLISQFGTSEDPTTWGNSTSCGVLQAHYDGYGCRYDVQTDACLDDDALIPWAQGTVDYDYATLSNDVAEHMGGDVPHPEYFYVADAQRFNCGALLRVSNPETGRCVVAYTEDGGPGTTYEGPDYGGRRILDSSPALIQYLMVASVGWANSTMMYVEWGLAGDEPGQACSPCESTPAEAGTESQRTPWDLNHMMYGLDCR